MVGRKDSKNVEGEKRKNGAEGRKADSKGERTAAAS